MRDRIVVYDVEIARAIPSNREPRYEDIEYCDGWEDIYRMGISVVCAYDYHTDRYRVFCDDNREEFIALVEARDIVCGFNNLAFDDRVVEATWGYRIDPGRSYDILVATWRAAGLGPKYVYPSHSGYGLEAMCEANLIGRKTGRGTQAPVDWQRGRVGSVVDYCLNDVALTVELLNRIIRYGRLRDPKTGGVLEYSFPYLT